MRFISAAAVACLFLCADAPPVVAQSVQHIFETPGTAVPPSPAPVRLPVSGYLVDSAGQPRSGTIALRLSLYAGREDPTPIWIEDQVVALGPQGFYSVQVGASRDEGLPVELFTVHDALWLGVAAAGDPETPRVALVAVPYAARASSADTLGGRQPGDFVLAEHLAASVQAALRG